MGVGLPRIQWLTEELGVSPALTRPRHLGVVRSDEATTFSGSALLLGTNAVGKSILEATDLADLEIRVDEALESPLLGHVRQLISAELFDSRNATTTDLPSIQDILPEDPARRLVEAIPVFREAGRLMTAYRALQNVSGSTPSAQAGQSALNTFYDPSLPPAFLRLLLQTARSDVAALALNAACWAPPLPPWLAEALVDLLVSGAWALVRLVSSLPGIEADEKFVPLSERLPFAELYERNVRAENGARVLVLLSEAQGDNPSTPWQQVPDER